MSTLLKIYRVAFAAGVIAMGLWLGGALAVAAALHWSGYHEGSDQF